MRRSVDCPVGGEFAPAEEIDAQVAELVSRLVLPEDWRKRLEELAEHKEEREEGFDAAGAGYQVGNTDASHFSREYKRLFGLPPLHDVERLREATSESAFA